MHCGPPNQTFVWAMAHPAHPAAPPCRSDSPLNSIATTVSGNVAKPMTSVVYDVIRLESIRGRSNVLIEGHFWRFWGNLNPKMLSAIVRTPKKALPYVTTRVLSHLAWIPCTGYFSRRVREKNKNKKERPYISRTSPGAPLRPIGTKFGLRVRLMDAINCAKFYRNRLRGLDSMSGQSLTIPIGWIAISPLTLCELLFTLW